MTCTQMRLAALFEAKVGFLCNDRNIEFIGRTGSICRGKSAFRYYHPESSLSANHLGPDIHDRQRIEFLHHRNADFSNVPGLMPNL